MVEPIDIRRTTRPSGAPGVEVVEFFLPGRDLVCPYFHQRFFTHDSARFICYAQLDDGTAGLLVEMATGNAWRLTAGGAGIHTGDLAPDGRTFHFTRDGAAWSVDIETGEEVERWPLPCDDGYQCMASVHINADGREVALGANREHVSGATMGRVYTVSAADGSAEVVIERPFRIGHVQFSTTDPGLIMYCHETGGASPQRMWLARTDGDHPGALFDDPGHPWVTHETFSGDGAVVVFILNPEGMGITRPDNTGLDVLDAPGAWHPGPGHDASYIIHDTHSGEIRLHQRATGQSVLISGGETQATRHHPHPRFAPDDRTVIWTSSREAAARPALADLTALVE